MKLLAVLVHRGLISAGVAQQALASGDVEAHLIACGACSLEEWQRWQRTDGDTRPELSRYELGELLGEGGVGRVFAATDRTDGRRVALKVLRAELAADKVQAERFVREARLLMELSHPHLVKGLRVAREGAVMFMAMEIVPGRCLQDVLGERERLDEETALQIVVDVAGALDALHARGLVHRDVKPGNVLWSEERGAVLIDLGFAVERGSDDGGETTAGTVHYIAPEQARGKGGLDVRADIYSLGATLYHLTTGSLPFEGETSDEVLAKQVLESLSGDRIRALDLSPQLHYYLEKMMAKDPELRFQDPSHLRREIEAFLQQRRTQRELEDRQQRDKPRLGQSRPGTSRFGGRAAKPGHGSRHRRRR
ncbi:MAG: serine/threonine protein kinase [Planctomycetes bacterium]|nr:serine/threonine protein kinase [Planctomycetota bacterium]